MSVIYDERLFCDLGTLAYQYDTCPETIRDTVKSLQKKGHIIETMKWGTKKTIKVNQKQLKVALLREYGCNL